MLKTKTILAAGAIALSASAASAGTVTFDFTAGPTTGFVPGLTYSSGGLDLALSATDYEISGSSVVTNPASAIKVKQQAGFGLASQFNCSGGVCDDNFRTDGSQFNEMLQFSFSKAVKIIGITFNPRKLGNDDFFDLAVDGVLKLSDLASVSYDVAQGFTGSLFGIGASADTSAFRVTSITVSYDDTTPVPLPAGGLLILTGLGALAAARKARRV